MSTRMTLSLTPRLHVWVDAFGGPVQLEMRTDGFSCDSGTQEVTCTMPLAEWDAAVDAYVTRRAQGGPPVALARARELLTAARIDVLPSGGAESPSVEVVQGYAPSSVEAQEAVVDALRALGVDRG